jgi:hypothetical protein
MIFTNNPVVVVVVVVVVVTTTTTTYYKYTVIEVLENQRYKLYWYREVRSKSFGKQTRYPTV